jgi:prepilin-type N-terminal cleavage/methylation domain-containing protein
MNKRRRNHAGYTLLELLFVISIISLLAGMLIPQLLIQRDRIIEAQAQKRLKNIGSVMADYALANRSGSYAEFQELKDSNMIRRDLTLSSIITDYSLYFITNDRSADGNNAQGYRGLFFGGNPDNQGNPADPADERANMEPPHSYTIIAYPRPERIHARLSTFAITEDNVVRVYSPGPGVSLDDPGTWSPIL